MDPLVIAPSRRTARPHTRLRRARAAVVVAFLTNGMLIGSWAPRIPDVKNHLALSSGTLGLALLGPALGSILIVRWIGVACARHGSGRVTRVASVVYCALAWVPGIAPNLPLLWLALLAWGMAMGSQDVAMNSQGVTVEGGYGRPVLAGFHAAWSIGTFIGAVLGGLGAAWQVPIAAQQAGIGAVLALAGTLCAHWFVADPAHEPGDVPDPPRLRRPRRPERRLVLLGVAAVFAMLSEGAVADWTGVLLRDHLHVTGGQVSLAYAAFCVTMTGGRLAGDRVVHALGRIRCLAVVAVVGSAGVLAGLLVDSLAGAVVGFALLGVGLAVMVPVFFSTAADTAGPSGPAIAAVSALGATGMLVGPSLIGLVAQFAGVPSALLMLAPLTLAAGLLGIGGVRITARARSAVPAATVS